MSAAIAVVRNRVESLMSGDEYMCDVEGSQSAVWSLDAFRRVIDMLDGDS